MTFTTIAKTTTHVVGSRLTLEAGRFTSEHRSEKAAKKQAAWLLRNSSDHKANGCEIWTREQVEAARAAIAA